MGRNKSKQALRAEKWAKERKRTNWDVVWKVIASVFAFAGSMVAVYELVNYFRSDARTFYSIIFPGLGIIALSVVLVQLIRKKNPYAILLLSFTIIGGVVGGIGWQSYNQTQEDKVIVLVAQFDGPEETYGLRGQIMEELRRATKGYGDTVILDGEVVVTPGQGNEFARELAEQVKADLVVWAWYRPTENPNITIHIENLSTEQIKTLQESETYQPQATLEDLESFEIQRALGSETTTLISFITALLNYEAGNYQTALERFENILLADDISTYISLLDLYTLIGFSHYNLQQFDLSIIDFKEIIESYPDDPNAYNNLGIIYRNLSEYESAFSAYEQAIEINPQFDKAYNSRGYAYDDLGKYLLAIEDYDQAIDINPEYIAAYNNRGVTYGRLEQYDLAIQDFTTAIEIDPQFVWAYKNRSFAYEKLGMINEAKADFKKYEELTGQKP